MKYAISGIALINGLKFRSGGITSTATRKSDGQISLKIKKHSKGMRKFQLIAFLVLLVFSLLPDASNTPESILYTVIIPITLFMIILRFIPKLRLLNYHGAEHKVIVAYRNRLPLTLEAVKPISRVTNVCGTMLIVPIIITILLLSVTVNLTENTLLHLTLTGVGLLFLFHYFLARGEDLTYVKLNQFLPFLKKGPYKIKSNPLYKLFDTVGYFLQEHFTTKEPSDEELEVAIACLRQLIR